jgi:DsbC/DsbD-like thiol-disulfide interchange protein
MFVSIALICLALTCDAGGDSKSESKVKAKATASKIDDKGNQTVTITLDITKDWHLYANPVNSDFLASAQTKVTFAVKGKTAPASVKYPPGKTKIEGKEKYDIYSGTVKIEANVRRTPGDTNPLEITIAVQACNDRLCLQQGKVKLTVP